MDFAVSPRRVALINVDMQNCFVQGYPTSAPDGLILLERINQLAAICRSAGILVITLVMSCDLTDPISACSKRSDR